VAIAGADGVLGGPDTAIGGGKDDNFSPAKGSPVIDASDAYLQAATDLLGQGRHDDPATPNTGTGAPIYIASSSMAVAPPAGTSGTFLPYGNEYVGGYATYALPFNFTFYGVTYSTIYVSPVGAIFFSSAAASNSTLAGNPTAANLAATAMIAPFWSANMDTRYGGVDGMWAISSSSGGVNYVTISFATTPTSGSYQTAPSTFAVRLGSDGSVLFEYGDNLTSAAVIGVSSGTNGNYTLAANSGQSNLSNTAAIGFTPDAADGLNYYDIGAIEFEGSSSNSQLPTIASTGGLPANGATSTSVFTSVTLAFSAALDAISATSAANYQLIAAGPDGKFGTSDDISIAVTPVYSAATNSVTLLLPGGPLPDGDYQLTVSPTNQLLDASGNPLNGDNNTTNSASPFVSQFKIDRSTIQPPVISGETTTTASNIPLDFTLSATDPQGLPVTFAIATAPLHGAIENFNATTGAFTYVPDIGYLGADTIVYSATDSKLASSQATISINVTAYRTPPVASAASASAISGQALTITLQGYDAQIPANQLVLSIVTQPKHGVVTITGQNTVSYVATNGYSGADAFTYAWSDTGTPVLTSAPATVSLSVITINHAPVAGTATISALENTPYIFKTADFPFSDPSDTPANNPKAVIFVSLPTLGLIADNGVAVAKGQAVSVADIVAGKLTYAAATGGVGAAYASFSYAWEDDGGTANGGADTSAPATATINVQSNVVTKAPTTSATVISALENQPYAFKATDFPFSDSNTPPNTIAAVIITTLPASGALTDSGVAVAANQAVAIADVEAGKLVFTPAANGFGESYASFGFEVQSNGGTGNGGVNISAPATATIDVGEVNLAPTTNATTISALENQAYTFKLADFPFSDPNIPAEALATVTIVTVPGGGTLLDGGAAVAAGSAISAADIAAGNLVYAPTANAFGVNHASFTFSVQDDGSLANGGVISSAIATATINVAQVNQAPITHATTISALENQTYTFKLADFPFTDPNVPTETLATVTIVTPPIGGTLLDGGAAVIAGAAISAADIAAGKLVYTPSANANGANQASFTFSVQDDGSTANGGVVSSTTATATINVGGVNQAPTTAATTLSALENQAYTFKLSDFPFSDPNVPAQTVASVKIGALVGGGTLLDGATAVTAGSTVSAADIAAGKLVYTPAANAYGAAYASFLFSVQDSGSTANGGVVTSALAKATIDVAQFNHAPVTDATAITINESGQHVFTAADFPFMDPNDPRPDSLAAIVIGALPGVGSLTLGGVAVTSGEVIAVADIAAGQLIYKPVTYQYGQNYASFTFQVRDNGGVAGGGSDTSTSATATINVARRIIAADKSYQIDVTGVTGQPYTSYAENFSSKGQLQGISYSNGMSATWTYATDGSYVVQYLGVTGQQYISYSQTHGTDGRVTSANYGNGMAATWTYAIDGSYSVAWTGVTGAAYVSYTQFYAANGRATSATYGNGQSATWTYAADGSFTVAYANGKGAAHSNYTMTYNSKGQPVSAVYGDGSTATWTRGAVDASYSVTYAGLTGTPYAGYTINYGANGEPASASYGNGQSETWTYSPGGTIAKIVYSGVTGAQYSGYAITYGANGNPASALYSNGQTETWSYAVNGEISSIAFAGVTGAAYTGYVITYGMNGNPASALYSNGEIETWAYATNGALASTTFANISGAQYSGYTIDYNANGAATKAVYSNGETETWVYAANGALISAAFAGVTGAPYTGYQITYGANGKAASALYDNGQTETWTYNASSGALVSTAYAGVTGAQYTGYTITYGGNGNAASAVFSNGETETWTYSSSGKLATVAFDGITGAAYSHYKITYGDNGNPMTASYSNGLLVTWTYNSRGQIATIAYSGILGAAYTNYVITYGPDGRPSSAAYNNGLAAKWTHKGDGSYQLLYSGVPGKFDGLNYATYDTSGVLASRTYYDASNKVVATITYSSGGKSTVTIGENDARPAPSTSSASVEARADASSPIEKAPIVLAAAEAAPPVARHDDALLLGVPRIETQAAARLETMIGPSPSRSDLAEAFFLGGILLPLAVKTRGAPATRKRPTLSTFDPLTDAFENVDPELDASELPHAAHDDAWEPDWDVLN
jgi:hypothetical protein